MQLTEPERRRATVRDGRTIVWSEWGAEDATPVLLCTGAAMSSSLGLDAATVAAADVRLLVVDRPGLGGSDRDPEKSFSSLAADSEAVLSAAGVDEAPLGIGFSQGAPFAVDLAARGLLSALAIVSGQDDVSDPEVRARLDPPVFGMVEAIAADPPGFEAAFAAQADADGLWDLVLSTSSPHDRTVYGTSPFADRYRACLDEGFAQGPEGYARDLVLAMSPWPGRPEEVTVPVDLWYGELDASTVHSPDHGARLDRRFPRSHRHLLAQEGGSLLWTCGDQVLAELRRP